MSVQRCDVAIAGAGIMGSAAAYELARRGLSVVAFDRWLTPNAQGSSHGDTRILRTAYFEAPEYVPLARRALELWRDLEERTGRSLFRRTGVLSIGPADGELVGGTLRSARAHGLDHELLDAAAVGRRFPALSPPREFVAVYEDEGGILEAEDSVFTFQTEARRSGVEIRNGETVLDWRATGDAVAVETEQGLYAAAHLVLAAGAWLPRLWPGLPLTVHRQPALWFQAVPDGAAFAPDRCPPHIWEYEAGRYFYALPDLGRGVKFARHYGGEEVDPETVSRDVVTADVDFARELLARHVPAANGPLLRGRACLYTNTPDRHFLLDRHPQSPAVIVMSPCSGHGFKFAPVLGEVVADWVTDGSTRHDVGLFALRGRAGGASAG